MTDKAKQVQTDMAEKVIAMIEAGTAPWMKPWEPGETSGPRNPTTGRSYTGGNRIALMMSGASDPRWATYKQFQGIGAQVSKGEKASPILLYVDSRRVPDNDEQGRQRKDANGKKMWRFVRLGQPFMKVHSVFNAGQVSGLPALEQSALTPKWAVIERAERVVDASGIEVRHVAGDRACYRVQPDYVQMPERGQFADAAGYYKTLLHELGHATGHASRLNRPTLIKHGGFGSETYAREELRAEMAAMIAGDRLEIGHDPQHGAAYVENWVSALRKDPAEIRKAAAEAERMADMVDRSRGSEGGAATHRCLAR